MVVHLNVHVHTRIPILNYTIADDEKLGSIGLSLPPCDSPTATPPMTDRKIPTTDTTTGSTVSFPISLTVGIIVSVMLIIIVIFTVSITLVVCLKARKYVSIASTEAVALQQSLLDANPQVKNNEAYATNIVTERNVVYETASNVASTLGEFEEDDAYWKPADTINDLYRQLLSNKYREIAQEEVE